ASPSNTCRRKQPGRPCSRRHSFTRSGSACSAPPPNSSNSSRGTAVATSSRRPHGRCGASSSRRHGGRGGSGTAGGGGGGGRGGLELSDVAGPTPPDADDLIAVDEALTRLVAVDPQAAELVNCHFFAGLSIEESAEALGLSRAGAYRLWAFARAWLRCE